jgi:hypothetical protein
LLAERERACDESVLASGHDPEVYAGGILKVCKFCIQSPLACVSGVSGADLGMRVRQIMTAEAARDVGAAKRVLLAGACTMALVLPVMAGFVDTPLARQVKHDVLAVQVRAKQAVTAMAQEIGMAPATPVTLTKLAPLKVKVAVPSLPQIEASPSIPAPSAQQQPGQQVAAVALAPPAMPVVQDTVTALDPRGEGDPEAMTCRAPQPLPGSRLRGPQVCKTNRAWAQLRADGKDVGPDGAIVDQTLSPSRLGMMGACSKAALLGAFQSQNIPQGSVLTNCR